MNLPRKPVRAQTPPPDMETATHGVVDSHHVQHPSSTSEPAEHSPASCPRDLLVAEGIIKDFGDRRGTGHRAVDDVLLTVAEGETLGLVGESGSGKTTLGRIITQLTPQTAGTVSFDGIDPTRLSRRSIRDFRSQVQMVFQDPFASLDPTKTVGYTVTEPLIVHGRATRRTSGQEAARLLELVGLDGVLAKRYPHELSGGQRQRVAIARAMALEPRLLVADEPTSALDISTRAEILNLLLTLQREQNLALLLISHDFATIRHLAHRIAVMYRGRIVEIGTAEQVLTHPWHPYTKTLLQAVPVADPVKQRQRRAEASARTPVDQTAIATSRLPSTAPDLGRHHDAPGCPYLGRCPEAVADCGTNRPVLVEVGSGHESACIRHHATHDPSRVETR